MEARAVALTMNVLLRSASVLAFLAAALVASAQLVITSGQASAVNAPTNVATFDRLTSYGIDLSAYQEDGLSVTTPNVNYFGSNPNKGNPSGGFSGGYYYPNTGTNRATLIQRVDGRSIVALQFVAGSGSFNTDTYLKFFGVRGGAVYSTATFDVLAGDVVGVADPLGLVPSTSALT